MSDKQTHWQKQILLFFISQCISLFGSQVVQMSIVWYVTLQTNSGAWIAAFSVCSYLPQFFLSFVGGVWADRFNRKTLIIAADGWIASVTLLMLLILPYITSASALLWALLLMSLVRSAGAGIQTPAVQAVIPQLVPQEHLMRWNGMNAALQSLVQFAAPAAAAVVLSSLSLRMALGIDWITALIGIGILVFIHLPARTNAPKHSSYQAKDGFGIRYACSSRVLRSLLIIYALFVFLTVPAGYLSGLLVSRVFGDTYWHLTAAELAGFGGMMAGGVTMSLWGGFQNRWHTLAAALAFFGIAAIGMGAVHHFAIYLVWMALYGVSLTAVQTTITTLLQQSADICMQGRIFGLMSSLYASCYPIGMALLGPVADIVPLPWMMVGSGVLLMVISLVTFGINEGITH